MRRTEAEGLEEEPAALAKEQNLKRAPLKSEGCATRRVQPSPLSRRLGGPSGKFIKDS
jgi:hypothetical protein